MKKADLEYIKETLDWLSENAVPEEFDRDMEDFFNKTQNSIDLAEKELNRLNLLDVSNELICTFQLGVDNCGFKHKDVFTCKHIRNCEMCGN